MGHKWSGERAGGKLQLVIVLLITAVIVIAVVRIVPVYVRDFEFKETVREEAKFASVRQSEPGGVRQRLLQKAQELGIPMAPEQIQVSPAGNGVRISVRYNVPVQLPGYTLTLNFQTSADTASAY